MKNINNFGHLKNIVSEERLWTYETMYDDMITKAHSIVCNKDIYGIQNKNRSLNWLYDDKLAFIENLEIIDVKEKYFAKRLIRTYIRNYKNRLRRKWQTKDIR